MKRFQKKKALAKRSAKSTVKKALKQTSKSSPKAAKTAAKPPPEPEPEAEDAIVAIDLGTQNTCVSIRRDATLLDNSTRLDLKLGSIITVQSWPEQRGDTANLSTAVMYPKDGLDDKLRWGNQVTNYLKDLDEQDDLDLDLMDVVTLLKLVLHKSEKSKDIVARIEAMAVRRHVNPNKFLQDFLNNIYNALRGKGGFLETFFDAPIRRVTFIIGCPPSWTDEEGEVLLKMAREAGMKAVHLGSEGEAMAVFYLSQNIKSIRVGQKYMVIDMGAGTTDIVIYKVLSANPLELQEETVADSVLCGGVFMDEKLRVLIKNKRPDASDRDLDKICRKFQEMKQNFDGTTIGLLSSIRFNIGVAGHVTVTCDEIRDHIFDPVIEDMIIAAKHVINRANARNVIEELNMIFGGGLSRNVYVMKRLKENFSKPQVNNTIPKIIQIYDFAAPNARGMLMLGPTTNPVKQRRSKVSVATYAIGEYDPDIHVDAEGNTISRQDCGAHQDPLAPGKWWVHEMRWAIRRDDLLDVNLKITLPREINIVHQVTKMQELIYFGKSSPPEADRHRDFTIIPDEKAEEEQIAAMGMERVELSWNFADGFDKGEAFRLITLEDGNRVYKVKWEFVIQYDQDDIYMQVHLKDKNQKIIQSTEPRGMKILLDPTDKDYLALGTLSTRTTREGRGLIV